MADHVFSMMLTFAHRLRDLWDDQRAHRWEPRKYDTAYEELGGRTMGILALGDIGTAVLWGLENVVLSPHASGVTPEMWDGRSSVVHRKQNESTPTIGMEDVVRQDGHQHFALVDAGEVWQRMFFLRGYENLLVDPIEDLPEV